MTITFRKNLEMQIVSKVASNFDVENLREQFRVPKGTLLIIERGVFCLF